MVTTNRFSEKFPACCAPTDRYKECVMESNGDDNAAGGENTVKREGDGLVHEAANDKEAAERKASDSSSDSDDETEEFKALWGRVEKVLEEYHLSRFAMAACKRWVRLMGDERNAHLTRIRDWLLLRINSRKRAKPLSNWQMGCPDLVPGLRANAFWSRDMAGMEWIRELEANFTVIRDELLALRGQNGFQPFRQPSWSTKLPAADVGAVSHDKGDWNVFYLFLHNQRCPPVPAGFEGNCAQCPQTAAFIDRVAPRQYKHAFFSALTPGTHVVKHTGPTNKKLRVHLPLVGVEGSRLRVGDTVMEQQAGECYVFDDSFEHEAWHDGHHTRIVLIFDVWHPDFSDEEVKFLSYLQNSQIKAERAMSAGEEGDDNFFALLEKTKGLLKNDSWWIAAAAEGGEAEQDNPDLPADAPAESTSRPD